MLNLLKESVLVLNAQWQPIGYCSVKKALEDLNSANESKKAMQIEYYQNTDGSYDMGKTTFCDPISWDKWYDLKPREHDECGIHTVSREIRVPTVVICSVYSKCPVKTFKPNKRNMYDKYGGICFWSGERLPFNDMNIEHVVSRDEWKRKEKKGSPNDELNVVIASKRVNSLKGNMSPVEFMKKYPQYKPHYKLTRSKPVAVAATIDFSRYADWSLFQYKA